jgi:hypothetical protein
VADPEWKPLPAGLWTLPAVFMEAGDLLLEAFMEGTADSFEAAKAAALYEAETALRKP